MDFRTIPEMFLQTTDYFRGKSRAAYMRKHAGSYIGISYDELREMTESFAMGLRRLGVSSGDKVGLVSENRIEWIIADFAITALGAADVPIFPTLTAEQEAYIFHHSESKVVICSNKFQLHKLLRIKDKLPLVQKVIVMNDDIETDDPWVLRFTDVTREGAALYPPEQRRSEFEKTARTVEPTDLLTIIYTSGTTGEPKGVMLTHKNMVANIYGCSDALPITEADVFLSYLPLCHAYERASGYYTVFSRKAMTAFAESIETVRDNLAEVRPTLMTSVPRLFERIMTRIYAQMQKEPPAKQRIFSWAVNIGKQCWRLESSGKAIPFLLKTQYALADKLVFHKIRERMGGRLRTFISGGAALPRDVGEFFHACGLRIMEGYGLTETSPVLTVSRLESIEIGTVGKPLFNVQISIANDGEILAKGDNIMLGYYKNPEATAEMINPNGWLHTGDIGVINERGNLVITDRKKSIFVSSGGKNIAPQPIENAISQSKYVDQVVLIGEKRDYCTALIVPDFDQLRDFARNNNISGTNEELVTRDAIVKEVFRDILQLQKEFSKFEKVRKITLLPEAFTVENGELTPKLNVKRKVVEAKYKSQIEAMYVE